LIWMQGHDAKPGNKYVKLVSPRPGQLAAISAYQDEVLYRSYGIRAGHIINNGINRSNFPEFNNVYRKIDLLAAGSLIPLKQYHLFIEIVKRLRDAGIMVHAVLAGKGPGEESLKKLVASYQLEDCVQLTGELPHHEVLRLMNEAKIFIHTSNYEGHSTVMLEALYSGCKVLAFLPAGDKQTDAFILCETLDEMMNRCEALLKQDLKHDRVIYSDMKDSAEKIQSTLLLMKQEDATGSRP
jgi:glycosyltransferase involved in cell wall biosynthesis